MAQSRMTRGLGGDRKSAAVRLDSGLQALGMELAPDARERLLDFLELLIRWNRAYNLTAVTDPVEMVDRHLLDSLAVRPWLAADRVLDAGSGAGLPGVPLAIACPGTHFILADSGGKKIRFLNHVRRSLVLDNIEPVHGRIEQLELAPPPGDIVARALAPLPKLVEWTARWLDGGARLVAMKGRLDDSERTAVGGAYNVRVIPLDAPGTSGARCLAIVEKLTGASA